MLKSIIGYVFVRPFLQKAGKHAAGPRARDGHREAGAHRRVARVPIDAGDEPPPRRRVSL